MDSTRPPALAPPGQPILPVTTSWRLHERLDC